MKLIIREADMNDLDFMNDLEHESFFITRQSHINSLKNSIESSHQLVYIVEINDDGRKIKAAAMIMFLYKKSVRIYSIAVKEKYREKGIGRKLIEKALHYANVNNYERVSIEVDIFNEELVNWYIKKGFEIEEILQDYYGEYESAYRMSIKLNRNCRDDDTYKTRNLIVAERKIEWLQNIPNTEFVYAEEYIENNEYQKYKFTRVFNMCDSYEYQKTGYYVSLLASARDQRTIPNETNINDFPIEMIIKKMCRDMNPVIQDSLAEIEENKISINIYFGFSMEKKYERMTRSLYNFISFPLMTVDFEKKSSWEIARIIPRSPGEIKAEEQKYARIFADKFFRQKRFAKIRFRHNKYNLAVLVDHSEKDPPSNQEAISKFVEAGERIGFYVEIITREDFARLKEFDALFIRATTDVSSFTYQFSRQAYAEGLVVIDDPWAIMRCSNKIYIEERMKKANISTPKTWIFSKNRAIEAQIEGISFPLVLKKPDSCYSLGVFKVDNEEELMQKSLEMFETSDLIMAQEFLFSNYDWRVTIIDHKPLFVCRYHMAKDHWQIYNWEKEGTDDNTGYVDTIDIKDAPSDVVETAVKATKLIGDGLYGVDLKKIGNKVYLIEINDNPSIDSGIEDRILEDDIYGQIMVSIMKRIEIARNIPRYIS